MDRLRLGGTLILDDAKLASVSLLARFMSRDPGWEMVRNFSGKTLVFRKARDDVLDVAWHMQPWVVAHSSKASGFVQCAKDLLRHLLRVG